MPSVITAPTPTLGTSEKTFYAQQIVDAFAKALDSNMCLTKIPVAIISQIEGYQQNLNDILASVGQPTQDIGAPIFTQATPTPITSREIDLLDIPVVQPPITVNNIDPSFISGLKSRLNNECIPCGVNIPDFDLGLVFKSLLDQIKTFISLIENVFKGLKPSYCHFAYFLSFLCIPDLVRILALILARIIQLTTGINLGTLSVSLFIMGILGAILQAIMSFVMSLLNIAVAPITCLIDSLESLLLKLPTQDNLARDMTDQEYMAFFGTPKPTPSPSPFDPYAAKLDDSYKSILNLIHAEFNSAKDVITDASNGVQQTFDDLIGLKNYMECEQNRNGNLFEKIEDVVDLIQLANLIASLLKKKVGNATLDELCRYKGLPTSDSATTNPLPLDQLAQVIDDTTQGITSIVTDDNNHPIGLIINPPAASSKPTTPGTNTDNNLSIYSCNLADFIRQNTLDNIISNSVPIAEANLLGSDPLHNPMFNVGGIRTRINIKNVVPTPNQIQILFASDGNTPVDPIAEINKIFGFSPLQDKSELNYYSVTNPKDLGDKLTIAKVNDSITTLAKNGKIAEKQFIINTVDQAVSVNGQQYINTSVKIIQGASITKSTQIKCGSIENIKANLDLINENL